MRLLYPRLRVQGRVRYRCRRMADLCREERQARTGDIQDLCKEGRQARTGDMQDPCREGHQVQRADMRGLCKEGRQAQTGDIQDLCREGRQAQRADMQGLRLDSVCRRGRNQVRQIRRIRTGRRVRTAPARIDQREIREGIHIMRRQDFYYELPEELIAQDPLEDRSSSRLLVLDKESGVVSHHVFRDITGYLEEGDCLVINDTKVLPARLIGSKEGTNAKIEILLLKRRENNIWETLVKPGKKAKIGTKIHFGDGILTGEVVDVVEEGNRLVQFTYEGIFEEILDRLGQMPLPPYITHQLEDKNRYQTVYAAHTGSAAAPTAGLHFTPELLRQIEEQGVDIAKVTLHVGLGTFRPVKADEITDHHMHSEFYQIDEEAAAKINRAKENRKRVICVGTTSCRTVESAADDAGRLRACSGWTDIFIYPGYRFKMLDCLITNFHLPESTLIMLVSALAGRENVLAAYREAVEEGYRFFSFGDAMFIN